MVGGLCYNWACKEKNGLSHRATQLSLSQILPGEDEAQQGEAAWSQEDRASGYPMRHKYCSGLVKGRDMAPDPVPHNSVCSGFCLDLNRAEPLGIWWVGPLEQESTSAQIPEVGYNTIPMMGKHQSGSQGNGDNVPHPKVTYSVTETT